MRLTEKKEVYIKELKTNGHIYFVDDILPSNYKLTGRSIDKLGQLEDIEDDLGIELTVFYKLLNPGFVNIIHPITKELVECIVTHLDHPWFNVTIFEDGYENDLIYKFRLFYKDYGTKWFLPERKLK